MTESSSPIIGHIAQIYSEAKSSFLMNSQKLSKNLVARKLERALVDSNEVLASLKSWGRLYPADSLPKQFSNLENKLSTFITNHDREDVIFEVIATLFRTEQFWKSLELHEAFANSNFIDFDKIFEQAVQESRIQELLDELLLGIEKIVSDQAFDSIKYKKILESLIETINRSRSSNFLTIYGTWKALGLAIRNISLEFVKQSPWIGPIVSGLEKTHADLAIEMQSAKEMASREISEEFSRLYKIQPLLTDSSNDDGKDSLFTLEVSDYRVRAVHPDGQTAQDSRK